MVETLRQIFSNHLWTIDGVLVLLISLVVTGILIPRILLISYRKNLFDIPDARKIHKGAVPRLGGMAFTPAIILSLASVMGLNILLGMDNVFELGTGPVNDDLVSFCFGLCSLMIMYLVGLSDDLVGVKYRAKFVAQIIAALLLVSAGLSIDNLDGFLGIYELPDILSIPLTVLVIVLVINAINLIDGIDGLASGLSAIALGFYFVVFYSCSLFIYGMLALALLGTLIQFFYYNVFGNAKVGKKIFMGDTGALTTGLVLCFLAVEISGMPVAQGKTSPLVLAFAPLMVPCLDVVRVFFHRIRRGQSPFQPGRTHIHHKFLALGIHQRVAMMLILLISALFIAVSVMLSPALPMELILVIDFLGWVVLNLCLTRAIRRRQQLKPESKELYD